jgi:hypothetical protein
MILLRDRFFPIVVAITLVLPASDEIHHLFGAKDINTAKTG